jgi:hypothetical protein
MSTDLWAVGRYAAADGAIEFMEVSNRDLTHDAEVAARRLLPYGIGQDDISLLLWSLADTAQIEPISLGVKRLGGVFCTADGERFDAPRTAAWLQQLELRAVIGLTPGVLAGLESADTHVTALLERCPIHIARVEAVPRLAELGVRASAMVFLGPAVAIECPDRSGAHIDPQSWDCSTRDGEIVITSVGRALTVEALPTGRAGTIVTGRCACGSDDPRVRLEPLA